MAGTFLETSMQRMHPTSEVPSSKGIPEFGQAALHASIEMDGNLLSVEVISGSTPAPFVSGQLAPRDRVDGVLPLAR